MNDLPRHTLARIISENGRAICDAPKRVEGLLRDLCGAHRREINIIMGALEERVAADLMSAGNSVPREVLLARLAARLRDNLAYTPEAARWGVETWAFALGIMSEAELQARARAESAEVERSDASPLVRASKPTATDSASTGSQEKSQPQRGTTYAPPAKQRQPPPQMPKAHPQPPPIIRQPAPAPRRMPTVQPTIAVPPPQDVLPSLPAPQTPRRGLTLRGCVIIVMLVVALIATVTFVIPAVLFLLQEEQAQPSINDPRNR
ncbi:MAG TPA: hypothetical protein VGO96_07340 [Pyrinomonadaceae bacterium]|jgi:hypothetical protein|nr:hypothetical protein [Pyrinomonadaceae bacterium]